MTYWQDFDNLVATGGLDPLLAAGVTLWVVAYGFRVLINLINSH